MKLFIDINKVCINEQRLLSLGQDHGEITHGTFSSFTPKLTGCSKNRGQLVHTTLVANLTK